MSATCGAMWKPWVGSLEITALSSRRQRVAANFELEPPTPGSSCAMLRDGTSAAPQRSTRELPGETGLKYHAYFINSLAFEAVSGISHGRFLPGGAGRDRGRAVGADGGRLGGAAAHRQFRLGRYHLDVLAWPRRRRQRAVAGRGRCTQCAAMAGRGAGGDLVAAARLAYRRAHREDIGRSALCRLRQRVGRRLPAKNVHLFAEPGVWVDPAGVCHFCRVAVSVGRAAAAGLLSAR